MYLLDTCVISDFVKGNENTLRKVKALAPSLLFISTNTQMEIEYGLKRIEERRHKIDPIIGSLYSCINILPFDEKTALCAAAIRVDLAKTGQLIGAYDFLIAASALTNNLVMVTANLSEFSRVNRLTIENWR
jgi:tRNA(fMet)-specific endonuclease VapC